MSRPRYKRRPLPEGGLLYIPQATSVKDAAVLLGWSLKRRIVGKFPYYDIQYNGRLASQHATTCGLEAAKRELERLAAAAWEEKKADGEEVR